VSAFPVACQKSRLIDAAGLVSDQIATILFGKIPSGKVFSGVLDSIQKREFTSIGTAVDIAARLQGLAREGEVLILEDTLVRLPDAITERPLHPVPVKGVDKPIRIYRVAAQ